MVNSCVLDGTELCGMDKTCGSWMKIFASAIIEIGEEFSVVVTESSCVHVMSMNMRGNVTLSCGMINHRLVLSVLCRIVHGISSEIDLSIPVTLSIKATHSLPISVS